MGAVAAQQVGVEVDPQESVLAEATELAIGWGL